jgi:glycerophosphoryl diester phosphodiesterase
MKVLNNIDMRHALSFFLALVLLSCTRPPRTLDLQGHRGARGLAPENTLIAFEKALTFPEVTTLELDVVISSDHKVVVSHEPWMNPTICLTDTVLTGEDARAMNLFKMTLEEIQRIDCGMAQHPDFPEQTSGSSRKPSLKEVLEFTANDWPMFNIETKTSPKGDGVFHPGPGKFVEILAAELMEMDAAYPEVDLTRKITIQSFDPRTLRAFRRLHLGVKLCLLTDKNSSPDELMDELGFPVDVFSPREDLVTGEMINWCHFRQIAVIPWTVNDTVRMQELVDMGVDGLISDYPNRFKSLVY